MNEIKGLIFDLDGTLIDTMPAHYRAWCEAIASYEYQLPEVVFYQMAGWPTIKVAEFVMEQCGNQEDPFIVAKRKEELFLSHVDEVSPIEETIKIARQQAGKLPMAIATGSVKKQADILLDKTGIRDLFQVVLTADDGLPPKPNPDIFLKAAELIGVRPQNCLVFEDGDAGLKAAKEGGMMYLDVRIPPILWLDSIKD